MALASMPASVSLGDCIQGNTGETVEKQALLRLVEAGEAFGLRVDECELGREQLEHLDRGGLVVDEDAAFAVGEDFAAKDDFGAFGIDAVGFKDGFGAGGGLEDARKRGLVGAVPNQFSRAFAT